MKKKMKKILAGVLALSLIVGIGGIAQAKNYNFSRVLPKLQNWGDVAKGVKSTSKKASINFSVIASDYKINVGHLKGNTQVSAKAYNLKKNDRRYFTVDSSAEKKTIKAGAQTSNWTIHGVEVSGKWNPDYK